MNVQELIEELEQYPDEMEVKHLWFDHPESVREVVVEDGDRCLPRQEGKVLVIK